MNTTPEIKNKRSTIPGKIPTVDQLGLGEIGINHADAIAYIRRERVGFPTDIVAIGAGVSVPNVLYVSTNGSDTNNGTTLGDAFASIKKAASVAKPSTTIKVIAGNYVEDNPLKLPDQISIVGSSLREVSVSPLNQGDLFHVGNGNYISDMSFTGASNTGAIGAFDENDQRYISQSPYFRNCTNFIPNSTGLRIDGRHALGPLKSMVVDSFTQNQSGGIGVSITNEAYAQLVSIFTITNGTSIFCDTGGSCDITNSNSSFGDYGLVANGIGPQKYVGIITQVAEENSDTFVLRITSPTLNVTNAVYTNTTGISTITVNTPHNYSVGMSVVLAGLSFTCTSGPGTYTFPSGVNGYIYEIKSVPSSTSFVINGGISTHVHTYNSGGTVSLDIVRPYDGQAVYIENLYYTVDDIIVSSGGTGYTNQPTVTISDPATPWGIAAQYTAEISGGGVIDFSQISNGRGYSQSPPTVTISSPDIGINTATATAVMKPTYYSILSSTPISSGICTITLTENVPYAVGLGSTVPFYRQSRIIASSHSFEYVGAGITLLTALPFRGGVTIQENEVISRNGGLVVYTSTDQKGDFRIGDDVVIDQATATISGRAFSQSLLNTVTPLIVALGGD